MTGSCWAMHGIMGDYWSRWLCLSSTFRRCKLSSLLKIGKCLEAHRNLDCNPVEQTRLESLWPENAGNNTGSLCSAQCDSQHSLLPVQLLPASCLSLVCVYLWVWVCVDCGPHPSDYIWTSLWEMTLWILVQVRETVPSSFCCTDDIILLSP